MSCAFDNLPVGGGASVGASVGSTEFSPKVPDNVDILCV